MWTLELACILIPEIAKVLELTHEAQKDIAHKSIEIILKSFKSTISANCANAMGDQGNKPVDLQREQRQERAMNIRMHLKNTIYPNLRDKGLMIMIDQLP